MKNKFFLACIFCFCSVIRLQSIELQFSERSLFPLMQTSFESPSHDNDKLPMFYINKGESYLASGQFDKAIHELYKGYELNLTIQPSQVELEFRSLFAIMLACICIDEEKTAFKISNYLQNLLDNWDCEDCSKIQPCNDEDYVNGPEQEPYDGWCEETVTSTAAALKAVIRASRLGLAAKESLIFTIDKFQNQALKCCAKGGLWKGCVAPLAKKLYEWRVLGIPPDPSWD